MEVRLDGTLVTTTMRTPGHDYELAAGFLFAEGLLEGAPVRRMRYCATSSAAASGYNVVSVDTGGAAPPPRARPAATTAACGVCGAESIDALCRRLAPFPAPIDVDAGLAEVVAGVPDRVGAAQELFSVTGAVHAAAAFDLTSGALAVVREDVGRHNAVDKVTGRLLLDGRLPAAGWGLFVSGRASFEIVQKAWAAGFALVAAVGGPSSLAVDTARRANLALVGFVRGQSMNLYSP